MFAHKWHLLVWVGVLAVSILDAALPRLVQIPLSLRVGCKIATALIGTERYHFWIDI